MIFYETDTWSSQIFRFQGTVWAKVWGKWLFIVAYNAAAYYYCVHVGEDLGEEKGHILGSTLSVLMVFRANTAYQRYWEGRTILTHFFTELREVVALALVCLPGGEGCQRLRWRRRRSHAGAEAEPKMDHRDQKLMMERVNVVRWSTVLAISMQLHSRILEEGLNHRSLSRETKWCIDWDRYRMRHLTTQEEFRSIDNYVTQLIVPRTLWDSPALSAHISGAKGLWDSPCPEGQDDFEVNMVPAMRLPMMVLCRLNQVLAHCVNDPRTQNQRWGMPERFATVFVGFSSRMLRCYTQMSQVVTTPLPFPYFHLCKTLMLIYFLSFPLFIVHKLGFWANVVEHSFLALALLGVDAIAVELENPFGIDDNDLDFYEKISAFEEEAMLFLRLSGDREAEKNFCWEDMPSELTKMCAQDVKHFLALRTQVDSDGGDPHAVVGGSHLLSHLASMAEHEEEIEEASDFTDDS